MAKNAKNKDLKKSTSPDELVKPLSRQLEPSELDQVSGGKIKLTDMHFIKSSDKAST